MKNKLEVGMYVRTPKGIAKIEEITEDRTEIYFNCDTGLSISFIKKDFTQEEMAEFYKHSYNIIDLIEEKDYVNGVSVEGYYTRYDEEKDDYIKIGIITLEDYWKGTFTSIEDIKSIVTKEMFSNVEYKVD